MSQSSTCSNASFAARLFTRRVITFAACAAALLSTGGCASSSGSGGILDKAMEVVGFSKPAPPEINADTIKLPSKPKTVTLRLHAADIVNTDSSGRPLALVARVYKLRSATALMQAPYDAFKDSTSERMLLGNDIVESREVVLTPGKKYEVIETMPSDATQIAVVALFRAPDPQRWKFVFDTQGAIKTGITLGLHACAMSVAEGDPIGASNEVRRLAGMQCPHD